MNPAETVSRETRRRLDEFSALLTRWNQSLNLVSKHDIHTGFQARHIDESLDIVPYLPAGIERLIDLGSGAGLPAIPIAIATGVTIDLIEADLRKAAFLQTAMARLSLKGRVWSERIERCSVAPAECITARALAPLPKLLSYAFRLLTPAGVALFLKGDRVEAELAFAQEHWRMEAQLERGASSRSRILKVSGLKRADDVTTR